jgi:hypothetical protein
MPNEAQGSVQSLPLEIRYAAKVRECEALAVLLDRANRMSAATAAERDLIADERDMFRERVNGMSAKFKELQDAVQALASSKRPSEPAAMAAPVAIEGGA